MFVAFSLKKIKKFLFLLILVAGCLLLAWMLLNRLFPLSHRALIDKYALAYDLDPALVCAVIHSESRFKTDAASHKGASGLMQLTEPTALWLAEKMGMTGFEYSQIFDPEINIQIGCYNLKRLMKQFDGGTEVALAAYNAGEGNVNRWLQDPQYSQDGQTLSYIPFGETREYIKRVNFATKVYRQLLILYGIIGGNND